MNSIVRFFALSLFVALAISATTGTFSNYLTNTATASTSVAALYTNGYVVTQTAAGWVIGDSLTLSTTASITWATATSITAGGWTGIGLVAVGCTTGAITASSTTIVATAGNACPGDFATIYSAAPTPTTTTTGGLAPATVTLAANQPVKYTLTAPSSTGTGTVIGITVNNNGGNNIALTAAGDPVVTTSPSNAAKQYALSSLTYAFYVQTSVGATVCFQNDYQHGQSTSCGTVATTAKSASIFSAAITGFVAMIALIFFN